MITKPYRENAGGKEARIAELEAETVRLEALLEKMEKPKVPAWYKWYPTHLVGGAALYFLVVWLYRCMGVVRDTVKAFLNDVFPKKVNKERVG